MSLPLPRQLTIKLGSCRRLLNDYKSYRTERQQLQAQYEKTQQQQPDDTGLIRRQHELVVEADATIGDITSRLYTSVEQLSNFMESNRDDSKIVGSEDYRKAESVLNEAARLLEIPIQQPTASAATVTSSSSSSIPGTSTAATNGISNTSAIAVDQRYVQHQQLLSNAKQYYSTNASPFNAATVQAELVNWLSLISPTSQPVVLVTSGGTAVNLEQNTVRFLDNFSSGMRGAISVEQFLKHNYRVIFLHREGTHEPYARQLQQQYGQHIDLQLMEYLNVNSDEEIVLRDKPSTHTTLSSTQQSQSSAAAPNKAAVAKAIDAYRQAVTNKQLLTYNFRTIHEYLHYLRAICEILKTASTQALVYSAAAVSDFYIPTKELSQHKIQSQGGQQQLTLTLTPTPKMLPMVTAEWCPQAFTVSFKLETDIDILISKAKAAIQNYGVHAVVANELHTRYNKVTLVTKADEQVFNRTPADSHEIEEQLVRKIVELHAQYAQQTR